MNKKEEIDILRIVKEDILELLGKEGGKVPIEVVGPEIKVSLFCISKSIKELEKENLVRVFEEDLISLTEKGLVKAEEAVKKHSVLEDYFKGTKDKKKAWRKAGILEHYVSTEVVDDIKKLSTLKREDISLNLLDKKNSLITNIVSDIGLFERMVSMGIFPGEKIKIFTRMPTSIVIGVGNKKFALSREIAEKIRVLKEI